MDTSHNQPSTLPSPQQAAEAGGFFRYMAEYVGFSAADAALIRQTRPIIAKHLPDIISDFYSHLLRYPLTRHLFLKPDGTINEAYLLLRMRHLSNFWLRTADGVFDDEYAAYVDHVGRAHTSRGADPTIYVPERYVIGQVGMVQHAISRAVSSELRAQGDDVEFSAVEAWDKLMMVLLEMLARAYGHEQQAGQGDGAPLMVDGLWVRAMAEQAIALEQGDSSAKPTRRVAVAAAAEIGDGQRKIVQVDGLAIGLFHHQGGWYAIRNSCIHQGGPVATGVLAGDVLTCPWHGYQYNLPSARCLTEPDAELDHYPVTVVGDSVYLDMPVSDPQPAAAPVQPPAAATVNAPGNVPENVIAKAPATTSTTTPTTPTAAPLADNEFRIADLPVGETLTVKDDTILVCNVDGAFYATDEACTHAQGPLSAGMLNGKIVTCPLHGSCFDVTTGAVTHGPATAALKCYAVTVDGEVGRVRVG